MNNARIAVLLSLSTFILTAFAVPALSHGVSFTDTDPDDGENNQLDLRSITQRHPEQAITFKIEMEEAFTDDDLTAPENDHYSLRFYVDTRGDDAAERWIVVDTKVKSGDLVPFVRVIEGARRPKPATDDDDFSGAGVFRRLDEKTVKIRIRGSLLRRNLENFKWQLLARGSYYEGNTGTIYDDYLPTVGVAKAHSSDG